MNLTVLGYWGAYPEKGEATAGYLLQTGKHNLLIDCGSGVLAQLFKYLTVDELDAVILSHYHYDHVADLGCLQYAVMIAQQLGKRPQKAEPLAIYGPAKTASFSQLTYKEFTVGKEIKQGRLLDIQGLKIEFLPTVHDEYNLAMKFTYDNKQLGYTGDTGYLEALAPFMEGCDLLLAETSLYADQKGQIKGHLSSAEVGQFASQAGIKQLMLTHFPHYGEIKNLQFEVQTLFNGRVELASTGKVLEI